jgi:hypothetical protein
MSRNLTGSIGRPSALALLAIAGLAGAASAQCDVYRPNIPDFDQRREDAPGIFGLQWNGSSHCVPSSVSDFVAYINNHGAPELLLNQPYDWSDYSGTYNYAGVLIGYLGFLMDTTSGGTGYSSFVTGMTDFFNDRAPDKFVVYTRHWNSLDDVSPEVAGDAMLNGGFAVCGRGTYAREEGTNVFARSGGHALAIRSVYDMCGSNPQFGLRDPNSSDSRFEQSPWANYFERLEERNVELRYSDDTTFYFSPWVFSNDYGPDTLKVLDGLRVIMPTFALTEEAIEGKWTVKPVRPLELTGPIRPTHGGGRLPAGVGNIAAIEIEPGTGNGLVFTTGEGATRPQVFCVRPGTGDVEPLGDLAGVPTAACTGDGNNFYVLMDRPTDFALTRFARHGGGGMQDYYTVTMEDILVSGMTFSPETDEILVIIGSTPGAGGHVKVFDGATLQAGADLTLPPEVRIDGPADLAVGLDGTILLCSKNVPTLYRLARTRQGLQLLETIALPPGTQPGCPTPTDSGRLIYTDRGSVHELERNANGAWTPQGRLFVGTEVGVFFSFSTSRGSIKDSELPGGARWTENSDEQLDGQRGDCAADFNDDGQVDFFDYLDFVAAFDSENWTSDFNEDGTIDFFDYLDFAAAFDRGC